ncbi:hypothetical protein H6G27_12205 [Nostoc linckia FACHB-104]|nr:hypothetical protein [Nostoc linckia FACHB-104]
MARWAIASNGKLIVGVWCLVFGVWCLVFGVWCLVFGVWCLVLVIYPYPLSFRGN